ncbi:hypothetical protein ACLOJK_025253 [Asimina triloba]
MNDRVLVLRFWSLPNTWPMDFNSWSATTMGGREVDNYSNTIDALPLPYDQWIPLPISGYRPSARYQQQWLKKNSILPGEVVMVDTYLIFRLGNFSSCLCYSAVLDLRTLTWSMVIPHPDPNNDSREALPASAGHNMVKWGDKLLVVAGHLKDHSDTVTVRSIDIGTYQYRIEKTYGKVPVARGGQSITLTGSKLIMFGGEDNSQKLLNDLHILDLETMTWDEIQTMQTPPAPRFDHTAAVHAERYLLIFGGCSHSTFFNDLHVLDLETLEWSQPQSQGEGVDSRAGHAGVAIDENWYIVGGGDNKSGASETLVLNMSKLVWSVVTSVKERDPLASEGVSLCYASINSEKLLIAFGGYNGNYNNEVFVLKPKPSGSSKPKIFQSPAAAAAAASVKAAYELTTTAINLDVKNKDDTASKEIIAKASQLDMTSEINAITAQKQELESALAKIRVENTRLKGDLDEMNNNHIELSKVQIEELNKRLESLQIVERELQILQLEKSTSEQDMILESEQGQKSGGVWRWIAG